MSMSGWWSMWSAMAATRPTNAIPFANASKEKVLVSASPRRDQPASDPSARWTSRSDSFCGMREFTTIGLRRASLLALLASGLLAEPVAAQSADTLPPRSAHYWRNLTLGAATSILLHEAGHIGTAIALGSHPRFGFDSYRPTVYSEIDSRTEPHKQYLFSVAGLVVQNTLDEAILDIPHERGSAFERGVLGGGIGTTLFYLTIGRWGSVSDIAFIAKVHGMTKTQSTLVF